MSLRTAIAAAILSLLLAACETARHDGIILEGAMLAEPDVYPLSQTTTTEGDAFLPTRGHRIVAGSDRVIGYREYSPGRLFWIDDESFEKITIQLPPDPPRDSGGLTIGDGSGLVIVYSEGGSAWPGSACFGTAVSGTVEYQRTWFGRWNVTVSLQAPPRIQPARNANRRASASDSARGPCRFMT